jgi:hypothetical protein
MSICEYSIWEIVDGDCRSDEGYTSCLKWMVFEEYRSNEWKSFGNNIFKNEEDAHLFIQQNREFFKNKNLIISKSIL